jgi:hypothetical protein
MKSHSVPLSAMLQNLSVPIMAVGFLKREHVGSRKPYAWQDRDCKYICKSSFSAGPRMNADDGYREFRTNGNCAAVAMSFVPLQILQIYPTFVMALMGQWYD